jgi:hypothetical protein
MGGEQLIELTLRSDSAFQAVVGMAFGATDEYSDGALPTVIHQPSLCLSTGHMGLPLAVLYPDNEFARIIVRFEGLYHSVLCHSNATHGLFFATTI